MFLHTCTQGLTTIVVIIIYGHIHIVGSYQAQMQQIGKLQYIVVS